MRGARQHPAVPADRVRQRSPDRESGIPGLRDLAAAGQRAFRLRKFRHQPRGHLGPTEDPLSLTRIIRTGSTPRMSRGRRPPRRRPRPSDDGPTPLSFSSNSNSLTRSCRVSPAPGVAAQAFPSARKLDMKLGMVGLGRMGRNMALRMKRAGHDLAGTDRSAETLAEVEKLGIRSFGTAGDLVRGLEAPRVLWAMIPAGPPVDD